MADLVMRKRPSMHSGEIGLFIDSQVFEDDFANIKTGTDIHVKATQSRNLKQMRLGWAIAAKVAQSGALGDADQREVMDYILMKCKHVKYVSHTFPSGLTETIPVVKSIRFHAMDGTDFNRLFNRMIYVVITDIIPQMPESEFRDKVESMSGVGTPEPEPPKRRRRVRDPAPVSVIPADEPVIGETPYSPALPASEGRPEDAGTDSNPKATHPSPSAQPVPPVPSNDAPEAGQAALPTNLPTWREYALAWIASYRSDHTKTVIDFATRWTNERSLRNKCGITDIDRQPVFEVYAAAIEEKRAQAT